MVGGLHWLRSLFYKWLEDWVAYVGSYADEEKGSQVPRIDAHSIVISGLCITAWFQPKNVGDLMTIGRDLA
jgi:hypothetical protein